MVTFIPMINNGKIFVKEFFDGIHPQCCIDGLLLYQNRLKQEGSREVLTDTDINCLGIDILGAGL